MIYDSCYEIVGSRDAMLTLRVISVGTVELQVRRAPNDSDVYIYTGVEECVAYSRRNMQWYRVDGSGNWHRANVNNPFAVFLESISRPITPIFNYQCAPLNNEELKRV